MRLNAMTAAGVAIFALSTVPAIGQGAPGDSVTFGWKRQFSGLLNLSQTHYDNWVKGGSDALSWDLNFAGSANLDQDKFLWENNAKVVYGRTKIAEQGSRKSMDEWNLETVYTRKLGTWVNPFASASGRSQFTAGYKYDDDAGTRALTSEFFDPAYFMEALGVGLSGVPDFKERLGFALKETFSANQGYADGDDVKVEYGLSSVTEYQRSIMENILASTKLDVFVNFKGVDEIDARWENKITAKINKIVSANFELEYLYDKDLDGSTQMREGLSIGIAFLSL